MTDDTTTTDHTSTDEDAGEATSLAERVLVGLGNAAGKASLAEQLLGNHGKAMAIAMGVTQIDDEALPAVVLSWTSLLVEATIGFDEYDQDTVDPDKIVANVVAYDGTVVDATADGAPDEVVWAVQFLHARLRHDTEATSTLVDQAFGPDPDTTDPEHLGHRICALVQVVAGSIHAWRADLARTSS